MKLKLILYISLYFSYSIEAQPDRWQQFVEYEMEIDFNVNNHTFDGSQNLRYTNNSPDTLDRVFYHLYFNAFQPGSMMDVRSRTISDPDRRVGARINSLNENEIGYQRVTNLIQDGKPVDFITEGTILEVDLITPILPGQTSVFEMTFKGQVPIQIRRSGRNNSEGIDYSMAQWYPKMAEYDYQGWHANPYIGREFYGVWGNYDVKINIDKTYIIGGTGVLMNAEDIGYGYTADKGISSTAKGDKLEWHFVAENVHDFMWAADPDYTHTSIDTKSGTTLHFFYQENERTKDNWEQLPKAMAAALEFMNKNYGKYPYPVYSFVQGGDGGMEYPMATLITGERNYASLVGVSIHEWMHSWYHMILGNNESLYPWMDEGFTSFASAETMNYLREINILNGNVRDNPHENSLRGLINFNSTGREEPLSTHADHYSTNRAYGVGAYTKGQVFLKQLEGIIGEKAFRSGLLRYFNTWKFKHPNANDFIRIMEKESGLELDWYKEYMVYTTKTADYSVDSVYSSGNRSIISLSKNGSMPLPIDVTIVTIDNKEHIYNIPLRIMRGDKSAKTSSPIKVAQDWPWVYPNYDLEVDIPLSNIKSVHIDKEYTFGDANRSDNDYVVNPE
jgi:hypothetical protein